MDSTRYFRHDAADKVTGAAKYAGDFHIDGMLYAKTLWPDFPCGIVKRIDTTLAEQCPGVVQVITRKDITGSNRSGMLGACDRPILIGEGETVRFRADALALVAAESEAQAERACRLIRVEYEPLEGAHSASQAQARGDAPCCVKEIQKGDMARGFAEAAVIVEGAYDNPYAEHAYLEPEGGIAYVDHQGVLHVTVGTQDIAQNQRMICKALGYPFHKVRVHCPYVGGAFGGKHSMSVQVHLALLAHHLRRPVRLVWSREESMAYSCKKQELSAKVRIGLDRAGRMTAYEARIQGPSAPYEGNAPDSLANFLKALCGPYRLDNIDMVGELYATTGPELGAFRGVGAPDGTFLTEVMLNKAAKELKMDPLELRRRNWMAGHEELARQVAGYDVRSTSSRWTMEAVMEAAVKEAGELPPPTAGRKTGRGYACAMPAFCTGNTGWHKGSTAELSLFLDGTLLIKMGFPELGQGVTGVATRLAAQALGIPEDKVTVMLSDSHVMPRAGALGFSQATVTGGNAVLDAAAKLKSLLEEAARACLGQPHRELAFRDGGFWDREEALALDWESFADYCFLEVLPLTATGRVTGSEEDRDSFGVTPVACVADVEVDEQTGEVRILQLIQCHDTGKVIHRESARGQVLGSAVMSVGAVMMERFAMGEGRTTTPSFAQYLIPTSMDLPLRNEVVFLEDNPGEGCPNGAKGLGEHGMYTVSSAIAGAVFDATGVCVTCMPISPEALLEDMGKI